MESRPGWSNNRLPAKDIICDIKGHERCYDLGMGALVIVCSRNTNGTYAVETRTGLWFGHGCSSDRTLSKQERNIGLGMGALVIAVIACSRNTNGIMVWAWMPSWSPYAVETGTELYGSGMDALAIVCSRNTNGIDLCLGQFGH